MEPKVTLSTKSVHNRLGKSAKEGLLVRSILSQVTVFGKPKKVCEKPSRKSIGEESPRTVVIS